MTQIEELTEQIRQIQWRLEELRREQPEKKIAVFCPEAWMKEIVAGVWGIEDDFIYNTQCGPIIHKENSVNNRIVACQTKEYAELTGYNVLSFQDFCKQHGEPDKPEYVKDQIGFVAHVSNFATDPLRTDRWVPATQKEYLEQEVEKLHEHNAKIDNSKKEPELKLNEEWNNFAHDLMYEWVQDKDDYLYGVKAMQKSIYTKALQYSNNGWDWQDACVLAIRDMKHGSIKPPKP